MAGGNDRFSYKLRYASRSLPVVLKVISLGAIALLAIISLAALVHSLSKLADFGVVVVVCLVLAILPLAVVLTLFLLRIVGYFRDAYRATNYGVPDLVELIRQLDKAVLAADLARDCSGEGAAAPKRNRVKLSLYWPQHGRLCGYQHRPHFVRRF